MLTIELPHPPSELSPNGNRAHWTKINAARKQCRQLAAKITTLHLFQHPIPIDSPPYTKYHITWNHYGTIIPDDDNVVARIKSYKDGICDALDINDRSIHLGSVTFMRNKHTKKKLWITLE